MVPFRLTRDFYVHNKMREPKFPHFCLLDDVDCHSFDCNLIAILVSNDTVELAVVHVALSGVVIRRGLVAGRSKCLVGSYLIVPLSSHAIALNIGLDAELFVLGSIHIGRLIQDIQFNRQSGHGCNFRCDTFSVCVSDNTVHLSIMAELAHRHRVGLTLVAIYRKVLVVLILIVPLILKVFTDHFNGSDSLFAQRNLYALGPSQDLLIGGGFDGVSPLTII